MPQDLMQEIKPPWLHITLPALLAQDLKSHTTLLPLNIEVDISYRAHKPIKNGSYG